MLQLTLTYDLLTPKSIGIICQPWPTKTPNLVSLNLIGFKLLSGQGFYAQGHFDLDPLTLKSIRMIYGSWPSMIPRKVNLGEISLKHGKDFANTRTDRRMALGIT